jgi:heptosyltransferase III
MEPVLGRLAAGSRIAVIRLRSLGDSVLTTPALALLKEFRPDLRIAVVVEPRFRAIFERNPAIDRILEPSVFELVRWRPQLAINFHGGTRSIVLTLASGARYRAGFMHYRARWAYNVVLPRAQWVFGEERTVHTAEHLASAMFYLGVPPRDIPRARLFSDAWPGRAPYALIHPFASSPDKAWPAEKFAAVARHLKDRRGLTPVIVCGPGDDASAFAGCERLTASLAELKAAMTSAALFVGNDSGPAHMAAACGLPVAVLFGTSDARVWAPWKAVASQTISNRDLAAVSVEEVLGAIARLEVRA